MGKGDRKSKRGKISKGSFGVSRPRKETRAKKIKNPGETDKAAGKKKK